MGRRLKYDISPKKTYRWPSRKADSLNDIQTDRKTDRQASRQTDRRTGKQYRTYRYTNIVDISANIYSQQIYILCTINLCTTGNHK